MNTFLEKVMRSPNARSRNAAASRISDARSAVRNSRDMAIAPVGRMLGKCGEVGRRVDVARQTRALHEDGLDALGARLLGMERGTGLGRGEGEADGGRRAKQHGVR